MMVVLSGEKSETTGLMMVIVTLPGMSAVQFPSVVLPQLYKFLLRSVAKGD